MAMIINNIFSVFSRLYAGAGGEGLEIAVDNAADIGRCTDRSRRQDSQDE